MNLALALTPFITVMTGVIVFVLGQIIMTLFIERIKLQNRTIERIAECLVIYAREYSNPRPTNPDPATANLFREAQVEFRRLAALLRSAPQTLSWYPLFERLALVKHRSMVKQASESLIGLSNCIGGDAAAVESALQFRTTIETALALQ